MITYWLQKAQTNVNELQEPLVNYYVPTKQSQH